MTIRIAIIQFPGSNCERETLLSVKRSGMLAEEFLWNETPSRLSEFAGFIIVGGFSYEDRSRAGVIAAQLPIMDTLKQQSECGKPVLGICNGAQILVEAGLVPGLEDYTIGMALTENKRIQQDKLLGTGYYNAWINMRLSDHYQLNAFTKKLTSKNILCIPIAHAEGRFVIPPALLDEMKRNGQCVFQYCDADGSIIEPFPINPNGSVDNIAAVSNKAGNVMAMMPHPERAPDGDLIFQSMRDYISHGYVQKVLPMQYQARYNKVIAYPSSKTSHEWIVDLSITDNHAMSVENALHQKGIPARIKRYVHWELNTTSPEIIEKIKATGVLFNSRKEILLKKNDVKQSSHMLFLVRAKEDLIGLQKCQLLKNHFNVKEIDSISHSILWKIENKFIEPVINSSILFNPYAHDYYYY